MPVLRSLPGYHKLHHSTKTEKPLPSSLFYLPLWGALWVLSLALGYRPFSHMWPLKGHMIPWKPDRLGSWPPTPAESSWTGGSPCSGGR